MSSWKFDSESSEGQWYYRLDDKGNIAIRCNANGTKDQDRVFVPLDLIPTIIETNKEN